MAIERHEITDRAQWLALRMQDVTASDIAAIVGVDPNRTPLKVFAEKTGIIPPTGDSPIMRRGRWLEAAVIEALRDEHPTWDVRRAGVYLRDPECRMGATPDAVAIDPEREGVGCIQCKVVSRPVFEREWIDRRAPLKFELQTLAEAMLIEASWAEVAALVIDTYSAELVEHPVPRHEAAEARIRDAVRGFWRAVDEGRQPQPVYEIDADLIDAYYTDPAPVEVDLRGDNRLASILVERAEIKARGSADDKRLAALDAEIKAKLGNAEIGVLPGWRISWKDQQRKEYVVPAATIRVLRVTDRREKEGIAA